MTVCIMVQAQTREQSLEKAYRKLFERYQQALSKIRELRKENRLLRDQIKNLKNEQGESKTTNENRPNIAIKPQNHYKILKREVVDKRIVTKVMMSILSKNCNKTDAEILLNKVLQKQLSYVYQYRNTPDMVFLWCFDNKNDFLAGYGQWFCMLRYDRGKITFSYRD